MAFGVGVDGAAAEFALGGWWWGLVLGVGEEGGEGGVFLDELVVAGEVVWGGWVVFVGVVDESF